MEFFSVGEDVRAAPPLSITSVGEDVLQAAKKNQQSQAAAFDGELVGFLRSQELQFVTPQPKTIPEIRHEIQTPSRCIAFARC